VKVPGRYTYRMRPLKRLTGRVVDQILEVLSGWDYCREPVPIYLQVCPVAYTEICFYGLNALRGLIRAAFGLHPQTPIEIEVYKCQD